MDIFENTIKFIKKNKKPFIAVSIILLVSGVGLGIYWDKLDAFLYKVSEEEKAEFNELVENYEEILWGEPDKSAADELVESLVQTPEGNYFEDINYEDESKANWNPIQHNARLKMMITQYGKDLITSNASIRENIIGTLDYWINNDIACPNWWYNEISTPKTLAEIGILLKKFLSDEQINNMKEIIGRGVLYFQHKSTGWTGANLLWAVETTMKFSMFANEPYLLKKAVVFAENEIFLSDDDSEGIKIDYTFYQHGVQQAILGYGSSYISTLANLALILNGTTFQFSEEKIDILVDFILMGQRYAIRGNNSNYLVNGRNYSRINGNNALSVKNSIDIFMSLEGCPKKVQLQEMYYSFDNLSYSINETKYFPYAHTLFDISPDYYMAVKGAYDGFKNSEQVNYENLLGRNLGYGGVTTYQYTGEEYNNISALWDFSKLPGTTAYNETDEQLEEYRNFASSTTHSDGKAEGKIGGLYVDIENEEGLYSRQAYITHNGLMLCLGTGLTNSKTGNRKEIFTTINQVYAKNASYGGTDIKGTVNIENNSAILNDKFSYYNLEGDNLFAEVSLVTGNLNRNNLFYEQEYSEEIFSLFYNFGTNPDGESFAYAVRANANNDAPANSDDLPISKFTNTNEIQAVEFEDGSAVIIFHQAGTFTTLSEDEISASSAIIHIINN